MILREENGVTYSRECECFKKKLSQERFSKTEIANKTKYTFKNYKANEELQKDILKKLKVMLVILKIIGFTQVDKQEQVKHIYVQLY